MNRQTETLGGLECIVIDNLPDGTQPTHVVVMCHGFGAPGNDLVPIGAETLRAFPSLHERVQFVFPAALLSLADQGMPGGRAWWPLDLEERLQAIAAGDLRILRNEFPPGMDDAAKALTACIGEIQETRGISSDALTLAGFSQGGMLVTHVTLESSEPFAGLAVFSGTLICEDRWKERLANRPTVPVLLSHGLQDPILPFAAAEWLRDLFQSSGWPVEFIEFNGPHTIAQPALIAFARRLEQVTV